MHTGSVNLEDQSKDLLPELPRRIAQSKASYTSNIKMNPLCVLLDEIRQERSSYDVSISINNFIPLEAEPLEPGIELTKSAMGDPFYQQSTP